MQKSVHTLFISTALVFSVSACSVSSGSEPLTVVAASKVLQDLPGLCPEIDVKLEASGEPRAFTAGGKEIANPGFTHITCGPEATQTSLFIFADKNDKAQAQEFACLNFAASNPNLVNDELSGEDWDVNWLNGTNWEGFAFGYPPEEVAEALGGKSSPRRDTCLPHVDAMIAVASSPLAPEPELERALTYLYALGYPAKDREGLISVLNLFCGLLATMDEQTLISSFAGDNANAIVTRKEAEQFIAALERGNYDCSKHKVKND